MSRSRAFVRGVVYSGGGMVFALAGAMVALKLITNTPTLTDADVGVYAMLAALSDFVVILNSLGMRSALPNLVGRAQGDDRDQLANAAVVWQGVVSACLGAVVLLAWLGVPALRQAVEAAGVAQLYPVLWALPLLFFASTLRETLLSVQAGLGHYGRRTLGQTAYTVAQVGLVGGLVWYGRGTLTTLLLALIAAHGFSALVLYAVLGVRRRLTCPAAPWRAGLRFARPLYINNVFGFVFQRLDTLLVGALLGPVAAGYFEMGGKKLPQYAVSILNAALVPFLPTMAERLAANDRAGAGRLLTQTYGLFAAMGFGGTLITLLSGEMLIRLLFAEAYLAGLPVLGWMMTAAVLALLTGIFGHALIALDRPHWVTLINVSLAAVSLGLNLVLIPKLGMMGAGFAAVSSVAVSLVLHAAAVRRSGLPLGVWGFARPMLAFLLALGVPSATGDSVYGGLVAIGLFIVLVFAFGVVTLDQLRRTLLAFFPACGTG